MREPRAGAYVGRYRLLRQLGRGGMGLVYEAVDPPLGRPVALKIVLPGLAGIEEYRDRFGREAAALARVRSRHIVQIHDYGKHDDCAYLVTELLPDGDLGAWLRQHGPMRPPEALRVLLQVAEGLHDAHVAGVVHHDVKPANVLLWRRNGALVPYLCDFGIAGAPRLGETLLAGSPAFMPPERQRGEEAGEPGDVYSAGCLLWAMLTGEPPYPGTETWQARAHQHAPVPRLLEVGAGVEPVNTLLETAMAKDPEDRFQSAAALRTAALETLSAVEARPTEPRDSSTRGSWKPCLVRLPVAATAAVLVVAGLVVPGLVVGLDRWQAGGSADPAAASRPRVRVQATGRYAYPNCPERGCYGYDVRVSGFSPGSYPLSVTRGGSRPWCQSEAQSPCSPVRVAVGDDGRGLVHGRFLSRARVRQMTVVVAGVTGRLS